MKRNVEVWDYAGKILDAVGKGVLLTTASGSQVNTMTIGWGTLGIQWREPIFTVFVRQSRHTKKMLDESGEFTINVPLEAGVQNIISYCGTKSGRDTDKIKDLGLHTEPAETVSAPGIRELPLTLECKVIYQQDQVLSAIDPQYQERYYKEGTGDAGDFHTAYYGKITAAYIIE